MRQPGFENTPTADEGA